MKLLHYFNRFVLNKYRHDYVNGLADVARHEIIIKLLQTKETVKCENNAREKSDAQSSMLIREQKH